MRSEEIHQRVNGNWSSVLAAAGLDQSYLSGKHGPCPMCGGKDRFRYTDKDQQGKWICNQCGHGDGLDLVQNVRGVDWNAAKDLVLETLGQDLPAAPQRPERDPEEMRKRLRAIRDKSKHARDATQVQKYLATRGLSLPQHLYWHPSLAYVDQDGTYVGKFPAMLGLVTSSTGRPLTYHRTYLQAAGKAPVDVPRKLMPMVESASSYAIRLYDHDPEQRLVIAEGVETAISCHEMWGCPAWSVISTDGMRKFEPPEGVAKIIVAGDNDANYAGQSAAYESARRLANQGYDVEVRIPRTAGDWNDVWMEETDAAA